MTAEAARRCPHCHELALTEDTYCEVCGSRLQAEHAETALDRLEEAAGFAGGVSDRGCLRKHNEDAVGVGALDDCAYAIVCDGVASTAGGQRAAAAAVASARATFHDALVRRTTTQWDPEAVMQSAIRSAQAAVLRIARREGAAHEGASCTFVAALWDREHTTVGSVGDSRAYWLGATTRLRLTVDDSWAQEQVDAGLMTEEAAMAAPDAHVITRWLGADAPEDPYRVSSFRPPEPGRVVLCSDGMWQYASSATDLDELVRMLAPSAAPSTLAGDLVAVACALGGSDNVTVAVIDVDPSRTKEAA
jgi:serine/threonine protein phosphatase PrpC